METICDLQIFLQVMVVFFRDETVKNEFIQYELKKVLARGKSARI